MSDLPFRIFTKNSVSYCYHCLLSFVVLVGFILFATTTCWHTKLSQHEPKFCETIRDGGGWLVGLGKTKSPVSRDSTARPCTLPIFGATIVDQTVDSGWRRNY